MVKTRDVRVPTTQLSLSPSISSLHMLPISRMSVYIFLTTFFSNPYSQSSFLSHLFSFVIFLSSTHVYRVFSLCLSFSALPSFPSYGNVCRVFHPEKWIFLFGKKAKKARIRYTLHEGALLARVQTKRFQTYERRPWREERRRGRVSKGEERELGVKQRWSQRENKNHASAYEERARG